MNLFISTAKRDRNWYLRMRTVKPRYQPLRTNKPRTRRLATR